jgi:hypothetical protein
MRTPVKKKNEVEKQKSCFTVTLKTLFAIKFVPLAKKMFRLRNCRKATPAVTAEVFSGNALFGSPVANNYSSSRKC